MSNLWTMAAVMAVLAGLTTGCDEAPAGALTGVMDGSGGMVGDGGGTDDMGVMSCTDEQVAACSTQNEESICRLHGEVASCDLPCEDSNECPGDTRCGLDGLCANACEDDEDCTNGDVCEGGACVIPNMGDMGMMDGPDGGMADDCGGACGNGTECREGRCVAVEN
ncbi:MAG: hypothetical protein KC653_02815, partial [Candidatus Andersenbacteria bacterium]|nr:hypothetical protein [Candidatus Andersenbacteria bacterium]